MAIRPSSKSGSGGGTLRPVIAYWAFAVLLVIGAVGLRYSGVEPVASASREVLIGAGVTIGLVGFAMNILFAMRAVRNFEADYLHGMGLSVSSTPQVGVSFTSGGRERPRRGPWSSPASVAAAVSPSRRLTSSHW
jgi:hypothetical protein